MMNDAPGLSDGEIGKERFDIGLVQHFAELAQHFAAKYA